MIGNAFALAVLSTIGAVIIYKKISPTVRKYIERFPLVADLTAAAIIYAGFGATLTALMAAAMAGILVSILLHIATHKEDFLYLYDAWDETIKYLRIIKDNLNKQGKAYRASRLSKEEPLTVEGILVDVP